MNIENVIKQLCKEDIQKKNANDIRNIGKPYFRMIKNESLDTIMQYCEMLLSTKDPALKILAFDWAYCARDKYQISIFEVFEKWLIEYVCDWIACDDFCTHAFGELLYQYPELYDRITNWISNEMFWVRRAASVIQIYSVKKNTCNQSRVFWIVKSLLGDHNELVLKGCGWLLKEYSIHNPKAVEMFLRNNVKTIPRIIFRYALKKMDPITKQSLMNL